MTPQKISRFNIIRELGRGSLGVVHLAFDPQHERQVAIRTLRTAGEHGERLLHAAGDVLKLQHANIVPLLESGEDQGELYWVSAYIEGGTLADRLKDGALPAVKAAELARCLLDALDYAHQHNVMHLDIKPSNIMLGKRGQPMLTDFGIAGILRKQTGPGTTPHSATRYMAPECISGDEPDVRADLYSLARVLHAMVSGTPGTAAAAPDRAIDGRLDALILKATSPNRDERYPNAATMRNALSEYLDSSGATAARNPHSTLESLMQRMRSKSDFPALSSIITEINTIVDSESGSASKLAQVILQDFALTNRLLRLVNTVSYRQFGGNINTISKAVVILGFETVRNIAMSLIMLEFMQNRAQAAQLKDEVIGSFLAGVVAMQLAVEHNIRDGEELMICSMFHNLGRMLSTFYFFEESQQILRLIEQGQGEGQAAIKVLGLSYNELGTGVAKSWNFPRRLLSGMEKLPAGEKPRSPRNEADHLRITVNLANELCVIAATTALSEKAQALHGLRLRYEDALDVSERKFNDAVREGLQELSRRAQSLELSTARSPLLDKVRLWSGHTVGQIAHADTGSDGMEGVHGIESVLKTDGTTAGYPAKPDPETILGDGIQDVTNTLVEDFKLNDLLLMVLETIYRGLGFKRALICIRDNKQNLMLARIGLGEDVNALIPNFRFSLAPGTDVFHLAIEKGADIVIEDVRAENIAGKIPAWYRGLVDAQSFVLLPVVVNKKTVGLFYADMQQANSLKLTERQLSLLRTLRNQAVLAIKQHL